MAQVIKTKNYKTFKTIQGNRVINANHVFNLTNSILKKNKLEFNPIIVNKEFEVIDGQHRLAVAKANNLDIFYVVDEDSDLEDVQALNANVKPWDMKDYLESYGSMGVQDYILLKEFIYEHDLSISNAMMLLSGNAITKQSTGLRERFKAGGYEAKHLKEATEFMEDLKVFLEHLEKGVPRDREFLSAFARARRNGDITRLKEQFVTSNYRIRFSDSAKDYLHQLEDVYNFKRQKRDTLY